MADIEMIDALKEAEKTNKANFLQEFERFQQYLKEQNSRLSKIDTRIRMVERTDRALAELGGVEAIGKFMQGGVQVVQTISKDDLSPVNNSISPLGPT